ncbi:ABC transporter permease [Chelatococcus asaccharovorans]|uniref:Peptide/nickel transport system permease protein n=1 Tax=Chelatococcus asaccharovorans TaxID=28210 RepID=A0A2V3UE50_9HYPH|nr:ABC transporter permease [Chelatococcus asaccharovorans]MBS7707094.1 ABC transporter permease [Chelatococcus asaccharovorans]PXW63274.1 peptide/nickel transport system permease protein [Chelatococcus asaccharovorans]CAH1652702.1 Peptide/nickel transport system permease protein [Chelatococcus asaccharovorans]CAH1693690.1 Peptide/nickel transport system permease protein [Chelatococcus asaccharovorans]
MRRFLVRRVGQVIGTIFGVVTLIFFLQRLTGDPTFLLVPETATQADIDALRHSLGFDRPLFVQYLDFLGQIVRFDLGRSVIQNIPVWDIIASRVPYTLQLAGGAFLVAFGLGIPVGIVLALHREHIAARVLAGIVLSAQSMPTFWSGILLIMIFAVTLGWLPPSSAGGIDHLIMPSFALGLLSMATFARITRTSLLDELSKDYVRTARSRGVPIGRLLVRHLARNASIPIITVSALEISNLLAGAVIVETVFAWPGLGQVTVQSILARDFLVVQGVVLLGAFVTVALNLAADLLYSAVDPRIRLDGGRR